MKKAVISVFSLVMLSSMVFSGCTPVAETSVESAEETVGSSDTQAETEQTEEEVWTAPTKLNEDKLKQAKEYCLSVDPTGGEGVPVYCEGIRGGGFTNVDDDLIFFNYSSLDSDSFDLNIKRSTGEVSMYFNLGYGDTRYYGNVSVELDGLEAFMDQAIADPGSVELYDDSALSDHEEDIKNDLPVLYSRFITLADNAFAELGFGLEDLGIDFGDKYRYIDPRKNTSKELDVVNEHDFVNGYCTDCGMCWTEYYYDVVGQFMGDHTGYSQLNVYLQGSDTMLARTDSVQCFADNENYGILHYQHRELDNDKDIDNAEILMIEIADFGGDLVSVVQYRYEQGMFYEGDGIISFKYQYSIILSEEPGEYDKVFESKESLMEHAKIALTVTSDDINEKNAWDTMTEDEIKALFEADGKTYYSKEEIVDRFWEHRANFFDSLDNGMVWMKTTLKDFGLNWK